MAFQFKNDFNKGVNLDLDQLRMPPNAALFLKNLTDNVNANPNSNAGAGANKLVRTPLEGNQVLTIAGMPSGTNYCIGFYSSEQTNEGYFGLFNDGGNHTIWVISGDDGSVRKVLEDSLLPFVLDPRYFLAEGRMTLELKSDVDPVTHLESTFKLLIITNNNGLQVMIDVEASVATNGYRTTYFSASSSFYDRKELLSLGATTPLKCIGLNTPNAYAPVPSDENKQNLLINSGWQFRIRTWDIWGRPSDWGIISSVYTVLTGSGCINTSNGLSRCVNLCFDAGNPLVKYITVAYRKGVGNDPSGQTDTGWFEHETFAKYNDSASVQWYARSLNSVFTTSGSGITFDASSNIITYSFCADKLSNPIDPTEAANTQPGLPLMSSSVFSINKSVGLANNLYGFQPVSQSVIDAMNFGVKSPSVIPCDAAPLRTITVYAVLYNPYTNTYPLLRSTYDVFTFGDGNSSLHPDDTSCSATNFKLGQVFGDQTNPGFIAYLAGTPNKVIGEWGNYNPATGAFTVNSYPWPGSFGFPNLKLTRFTFTGVPAGKYSIRLASHHATINDADLQKTSTQVAGLCTINDINAGTVMDAYSGKPLKEIVVDCSFGDVTLGGAGDPIFTIIDLNDGGDSNGIDGYFYEQEGGAPIEMAPCNFWGQNVIFGTTITHDGYGSFFTDHNGYYFMGTSGLIAFINIAVDLCNGLGASVLYTQNSGCSSSNGKMMHGDGQAPRSPDYWGNNGNWRNRVYAAAPGKPYTTFPSSGRRIVRQQITVCGSTTLGIPGIPITMTKSPSTITDSSGLAQIIAHSRYDWLGVYPAATTPGAGLLPVYSAYPDNQDELIISQRGGCQWNICGSCDIALTPIIVTYLGCGDLSGMGCSPSGVITTAKVGRFAGSSFAINDELTIDGGSVLAKIKITAVDGGGAVLTFSIENGGEGYLLGFHTTTPLSGTGAGLEINVTATEPPERSLCMAPLQFSPNGINITGIQSGGKYPVAVWYHDFLGRHTAPQIKMGDKGYVFVPNLNDSGTPPYPSMSLSTLQLTIPSGLTVSSAFTKMTVLIGNNVLFSDYFSWAADWVQYIDATGTTNNTNPTAIRVYIQSLNEYNKLYNQKTNVAWDFLTAAGQSGEPTDVVQFIMNGDGTWLPAQKGAPITYDKNGAFFTVDFVPELAGLQNGCLFRVVRPKQNTTGTDVPYYEQCLTIPITNGSIPAGTYDIPYRDSYLLSRSIPVPLLKGQTRPVAPGGVATNIQYTSVNQDSNLETSGYSENNIANANGVVIWQTEDAQTSFPFFFESPSPSDLWGSHLFTPGRVGIPDMLAQQTRIDTEIAISLPLSDRGFTNGIGIYQSSLKQIFDHNTWGGIRVVLVETGVILVICDRDHFVTRYNGSTVRVDPQGNLIAQNQYGIFTSPERKAGTNYGCRESDINTIQKYAGIVRWVDRTGYIVLHNFSTADSNTDEAGYLGYLLNLLGNVNALNANPAFGTTYLVGGIDVKNYEYYLTSFNIPHGGLSTPSYINNDSEPLLTANVTMFFDLRTSLLKGFASFTYEMYGKIPGYFSQRQFLSFKQGQPYLHHWGPSAGYAQPAYANFHGVQCPVRLTHVINGVDAALLPDKVKRFLYEEVYCKQSIAPVTSPPSLPVALFYADTIISEKGQVSRLLVPRWALRDGYQTAAFICDLNTPFDPNIPVQTGSNVILDGNQLQGRWLLVSLTNNPAWAGTYFELSEAVGYIAPLEKSAD